MMGAGRLLALGPGRGEVLGEALGSMVAEVMTIFRSGRLGRIRRR